MTEEKEEKGDAPNSNHLVDASHMNMFSKSTKSFMLKNLVFGVVLLDLSSNHIDEDCSKLLAEHLCSNKCTIRSLSVEYCHLTHKCSTIIFSAIGNSPLYEFYADNNILSNENCLALAHSLSKNPPLELLSVVGCQISSDSFIQLFTGLPKSKKLKHLRFDSNSMLDPSAIALADILPSLHLESLGVSDNEIWRDGTTAIIQACLRCDTLFSLDIGYNIVDFFELGLYVQKSEKLRFLGISGSKIYEEQLNNFLTIIGQSKITTLLLEGINFHHMPISWGKATENAFSNQSHIAHLIKCFDSNSYLKDVRLGFFELEQLLTLYEARKPSWNFTLSFHNFGKTRNTWLIHFPDFKIESPCNKLFWNTRISPGAVSILNVILKNTSFNGKPIEIIDLHGTKLNDEGYCKFFAELLPKTYTELDLSNTDLRNNSIDSLIEFLKKPDSYIERLHMQRTKSSAAAFQVYFQFLNEYPEKCPKILSFRFESSKPREENSVLDYSGEIGQLLEKNPALVELRLGGQVTGKDANNIISKLKFNSNLRFLELHSDLFDRYKSADPELDEQLLAVFNDFVEMFHEAILSEDTKCILEEFSFPLLTELFLGSIPNISLWPSILRKLESNYNAHLDNQPKH
ncbi:hypothetical protein TRFO_36592 [Tritrichomonas foetus]|uniref:Leucine Rich Repeat family protein n=1 Tax=Tritrichomonas foetus TaxID=1144522 RepID=A0A1J4JDH6_9EUKA|nr:hypothetical protein TRFO_36592 [Tritrichomonas foetus]|eukprot:OHS97210.1 hypothetical protein TRFO_36592 [Tritrichomonas foetus]